MVKAASKKEPLVRISKQEPSLAESIAVRIAAIVLALAVNGFIIFWITGINPLQAYVTMFDGAFGTQRRLWITIRDSMVLLLIAVALAPAFRMRFWNIGAEGQVLVGGIVTAACMIYLGNLPTPLLFTVMAVACILAGAVWAFIPAIFKAKFNTNETLFTLMMNYVAIQLTSFFVAKWENPFGSNSVGVINQSTKTGWFPTIFGNVLYANNWMLNVIIVLAIALVMYIYLKYSKHGYEISVVGESERTARYAGINVNRVIIRTMLLSGAICGIAGMINVASIDHSISVNTAGGRGFTAIIVAWLAKFNTVTMILIAFMLVFLDRGAVEIASAFGLNEYASEMLTGVILFFILGSEFFIKYRLIFRSHREVY